jgi:hypothetical protein
MVRVYGRIGVITACCVQVTACGFLLTNGPPNDYESMNYFTCSEGKIGPTLDLVWAGLSLVGAATYSSDDASSSGVSASSVRAVGGAEALLWGASGIVGYGKVSRCRDAKQDLADRQSSGKRPRSSLDSKESTSPFSWATGGHASSLRLITSSQATARNAPNAIQWTGLRPLSEDLTSQISARR